MGGSKGGRDMEKWRRDIAEMGLSRFEVATWEAMGEVVTWIFGVATWKSHCGQKTMSRHEIDVAT